MASRTGRSGNRSFTPSPQIAGIWRVDGLGWPRDVRGVRELAEQPGHHERGLLADVDRVVADALERTGDEDHVHRPLAHVDVVAGVEREPEDLAVEAVDLLVLAHEVLGEREVAQLEALLGLAHLGARELAHLLDALEDVA